MSSQGAERRREVRYSARFDVRFGKATDAARALNAFSVNFSSGGLCLRSKSPHELGESLKLDLTIEGQAFSIDGVVAWIRGEAVGVRFVNLHPQVRARLEEVARLLSHKAPIAEDVDLS